MEKGIVRRLTNVDGNENPYVFTWSDTIPCTTWAVGSGCSTFYNTAEEDKANTHMKRFFNENRFEIYATKDINAGEELLHVYKSKKWRKCFESLNSTVSSNVVEQKDESINAASGPNHEKKDQESVTNNSTSSTDELEKESTAAEEPSSSKSSAESKGDKGNLLDVLFQDESSKTTSTLSVDESMNDLSVEAQGDSSNLTSSPPVNESTKDSSVVVQEESSDITSTPSGDKSVKDSSEDVAPPTESNNTSETLRSVFFNTEA